MVEIHDYDIALVEKEILIMYNDNRHDYSDYECLLSLRKDMINKRVLAHQEEVLPDIVAFNDALTEALREMYDRAHRICDYMKRNDEIENDLELTAKCFLCHDYPKLHPVQGEDRMELWEAICDSEWNILYGDGVTLPTLTLPIYDMPFDHFIGMDCPPPNWNEGLDRELTKDLHLTSAFHHLFQHMKFAITDFIYIRKFETEYKIQISNARNEENYE